MIEALPVPALAVGRAAWQAYTRPFRMNHSG